MAASLVARVQELMGRQIPLSALFRRPTVKSLAQLMQQEADIIGDPVIMEIQRGGPKRLPFFAIVPPGEESLGYATLARHMGPEQSVYKVQGHAPVTGGKRPYSKQEMEALTEECIAALRTVQPHGPYCLGGLCDGAHIAQQIVLRLESQNEEIGLLAIFDTWVLEHSQRWWLWKVNYLWQRVQEMKQLNFAERLSSYKRVAQKKVQILAGTKSLRTDWHQAYWPENFTLPRFRAPVVLFKRPKQPFYYVNDPQMGWGKRSESGVEIHEIDFHHLHILREPHVRFFGEKVAECIERVSRNNANGHKTPENSESSALTTVGGYRDQIPPHPRTELPRAGFPGPAD
jgi:thioesterase domain-containing protein